MSRTYRKPLIMISLGFRDRSKTGWRMGSYRKDTWHDNKQYRAEKENYNQRMMRLEIKEFYAESEYNKEVARSPWEMFEWAERYDTYLHYECVI